MDVKMNKVENSEYKTQFGIYTQICFKEKLRLPTKGVKTSPPNICLFQKEGKFDMNKLSELPNRNVR